MTDSKWPFPVPKNHAAITYDTIADYSQHIFLVTHDYDDGQWQCLPEIQGQPDIAQAKLVSLESLVAQDPTLLELADLPKGYKAIRQSPTAPWIRTPNHPKTIIAPL